MIEDDPLWNPQHDEDPQRRAWRATLAPYALAARGLAEWNPPRVVRATPRLARWKWPLAAAALVGGVAVLHHHRMAWDEGRPWSVAAIADAPSTTLQPGQRIVTDANHGTSITVARIGTIELSPASSLRLLATRGGHHRVDLEQGHLRARIWAPPGYFGVSDGRSEIVDLGCDFDVWRQADGNGRVSVRSGWIAWRNGAAERLVPAGYEVRFVGDRISLPLRVEADVALRQAMAAFETQQAAVANDPVAFARVADHIADVASDADAMSLLSLLTEHPELASSRVYPRLARALGLPVDDAHRQAWQQGSRAAIDAWWARLPTQPKRWWMNWRDVFA